MKNSPLAVFTFAFLSILLNSSAQDYLITFAGTGASATVSTVEVENLATGKSLTLNGGDTLHLTSDNVGISQLEKINLSMNIYPNPMMDNSILAINSPKEGDAVITLYEMTGKTVAQIHTYLENYKQEFNLTGLKKGMYLINVNGNAFQYSGKILCNGQADGIPGIEKVSSTIESKLEKNSKKEFTEKQGTVNMQYIAGDRLKFKAISGIYSTVKTDILTEDKKLTFIFVPCIDGENNNYPVVEIGGQIWMAENLKTRQFNDVTPIPLVTNDAEWNALTTPGYCWYNNDSATYYSTYGVLYNWFVVNTGKLCPEGWHVPADAEWKILANYLGGRLIAGRKLKEAGLVHWLEPNELTTNETGFRALPGGFRFISGPFWDLGAFCYLWSSNEYDTDNAKHHGMHYKYGDLFEAYGRKQNGFSVRCVKDY